MQREKRRFVDILSLCMCIHVCPWSLQRLTASWSSAEVVRRQVYLLLQMRSFNLGLQETDADLALTSQNIRLCIAVDYSFPK